MIQVRLKKFFQGAMRGEIIGLPDGFAKALVDLGGAEYLTPPLAVIEVPTVEILEAPTETLDPKPSEVGPLDIPRLVTLPNNIYKQGKPRKK